MKLLKYAIMMPVTDGGTRENTFHVICFEKRRIKAMSLLVSEAKKKKDVTSAV